MKKQSIKIKVSLKEMKQAGFEGGFMVLQSRASVVGGVNDPVNNCQGGTCQTNNCNGGNCGNCVFACGKD